MEELPSGEVVVIYIAPVHELSCDTMVYKRFDFSGDCGLDLHFDDQGFGACSGCNYILLWKASLPGMELEELIWLDRFVCDFIQWLHWW